MVMPAAGADGVLLERAKTGMRFAGIDNLGARAGNRVHVAAGCRCDCGEKLHEVERGALTDKESCELPLDFGEQIPGLELGSLGLERNDSGIGAGDPKDPLDKKAAGENHARFFYSDQRTTALLRRDGRRGSDIALPDVLGERAADLLSDLELVEQLHPLAAPSSCFNCSASIRCCD